jgi:hypothetical protein
MPGRINLTRLPLDPLHRAVSDLDKEVARLERLHRRLRQAQPFDDRSLRRLKRPWRSAKRSACRGDKRRLD